MTPLLAIGGWILSGCLTSPQAAIQAQYNRWSKAYVANDVDTLLSILTPDYTLTSFDKHITTYSVYKAYLNLRKKAPKETTEYHTEIRSVTRHGPNADVDAVETMVTAGSTLRKPVLVSVHKHEYLDRWTRIGGVWRLHGTMTLKESTVVKQKR